MTSRAPQGGGCLLILAIFMGGGIGLQQGMAGRGLMLGAIAGILLAAGFFLWDRRRGR